MRLLQCLLAGMLLAAATGSTQAGSGQPGDFDYYVLSLSWAPSYCDTQNGRRDRQQCSPGRRFAFVVHGLWPQHLSGWPERCETRDRWVDDRQIRQMLDIMPSKGLIIHEWKTHGTCSGLSQADYFRLTRELFEKVRIPARYLEPTSAVVISPERLVQDFTKTNRGLTPEMISVQCGNRRDRASLRELRVCFSRQGQVQACGENERRQCQARELVLPPVR